MINHDGRLSNGFCCNGQRPAPGLGCKGGNTTCLPFWRVCIAELAPDMITVMGKEGIVLGNSSILSNIGQSTSFNLLTTTKRPSMIQNFFSKYIVFFKQLNLIRFILPLIDYLAIIVVTRINTSKKLLTIYHLALAMSVFGPAKF